MTNLAKQIRRSVKSGSSVPAVVMDIFSSKVTVKLAGNGALMHNLAVIGGPVSIGQSVQVDFTTPVPTVVAESLSGALADLIGDLSQAAADAAMGLPPPLPAPKPAPGGAPPGAAGAHPAVLIHTLQALHDGENPVSMVNNSGYMGRYSFPKAGIGYPFYEAWTHTILLSDAPVAYVILDMGAQIAASKVFCTLSAYTGTVTPFQDVANNGQYPTDTYAVEVTFAWQEVAVAGGGQLRTQKMCELPLAGMVTGNHVGLYFAMDRSVAEKDTKNDPVYFRGFVLVAPPEE